MATSGILCQERKSAERVTEMTDNENGELTEKYTTKPTINLTWQTNENCFYNRSNRGNRPRKVCTQYCNSHHSWVTTLFSTLITNTTTKQQQPSPFARTWIILQQTCNITPAETVTTAILMIIFLVKPIIFITIQYAMEQNTINN